jgi:hypothetical protein
MIERGIVDYNLVDALESINWNHGRGKITGYRLDPDDNSGRVSGIAYRRVPVTQRDGFTEERRFRVVGRTVHFLRHQRQLGA